MSLSGRGLLLLAVFSSGCWADFPDDRLTKDAGPGAPDGDAGIVEGGTQSDLRSDAPAGNLDGPRPDKSVSPDKSIAPDKSIPPDSAPPDPDSAPPCPKECSSCAGGVCSLTGKCADGCACPAGWDCEVACDATNGCDGEINCSKGGDCTVTCSERSCRKKSIICGSGTCTVTCKDDGSCDGKGFDGIDCSKSCACAVSCGANTCDYDKDVTCPGACKDCRPGDNCDSC